MKEREIKEEQDREEREAGFCTGDLLHISYDQLADGGRHPYQPKKIDPETEAALRRLYEV